MAYTLYLYKEFPSKSNKTIRLEIFQKDYVGSAIEIEELAGNPIILNTDNSANDIDVPIIKTSLSINIIDTNQFDYSIFFTPDATKFKVIVKVSGTIEWTGFLTPDSFVQSESYRSSISLIARDNIGMLAEFEYDGTQLPVKINTTINNAFTKINFGGVLEYRVKKLDNAGINILNDIVNGKLFVGRNYYEVVEILLRGIGCQLRYVGGNKYAIFDIADLKGYGETLTAQTFLFIEQSGAVEIVPARKSIKITQDYGLQESIYDGPIPTEDFSFIEQRNAGLQYLTYRLPRPPVPAEQQDFYVNYYNIPIGARWVSTMALLEPTYFQRPESSILITGTNTESIVGLGKLMYSRAIPETNRDTNLKITVDVSKLIYGVGKYQRIGDELALWDMRIGTSNSKLHFRCNFFFDDGTTIQYLSSGGWREKPLDYADRFDIVLEQVEDESSTDTPYQTLEFNLGNADSAGTLTMEIYPYWLENNTLSLNVSAYVMELRDFDIKFVRLDEKIGGVESVGVINNDYNLAAEVNLSIGQVPNYLGNNLTMLAGIFQDASYYPPAFDFHRPSGTNYKLFELIGREIAHHYKTQRKKLSGNIINSENFAAMPSFAKPFYDGEKYYALNYGSLDFRNEVMSVELIEVEDYATDDFTFIDAEIDTGGGESLGSGETEFIQWSAAGNAKRIYELDNASEADQAGAFVFIDKSGLSAAKKVPISSLLVDAYTKTESDSRFASIDGDLTQDFSAKKLTTATLLLPQTAPILASGEAAIYSLDSGFSGELPSGAGSVTSIALTMPTGFSVSGSPITESGTFGVTFASGYFLPTTTQFASKADVSLIGAANGIAPLDSGGKVALQYLPSTLLKYMGVWDASTNTPTLLATDVNRKGQVWNVSVAGTQFGIAFKLGDWLIYNDSGVAEKSDNSDDVVSVNGYTGAVTLKTSDIAEQTNLYYTDARVKAYADTLYTPLAHASATNNPHSVTAEQVGALALSGGALTSSNLSVLEIVRTTGYGLIKFIKDSTTNIGWLGVSADETPVYLNASGTTRSIYHSGNSNLSSVDWAAAKLSSTTLLLPQTAPTLSSGEMAIYGLESGFSGELPSGAGSVTSISMVVPTGLSVTPATITESGTFTISYASGYQMMTSTESSKLAGIEANANNYTLPTATNLVLGGVKIGSNITITDGVISVAAPYTLPTATTSVLGGVKIGTNVTITDGVISVHNPITLGTANGLSLSTQVLSLGLASTSTNGALSSTDWNTFNSKAAGDHNHNGVYALIGGATTQDFQVKALTMNGALSGATTGSFSGNVSAASFTSGGNAVLHAGNYSSYALPLSGGAMSGAIRIGQFDYGLNTGEARIGRAQDRSVGTLTIQLGNDSSRIFEVVDKDWTTVVFSAGMGGIYYKGNSLIHSGNIGSQSVNYAASAGNADTLDGYHYSSFATSGHDHSHFYTKYSYPNNIVQSTTAEALSGTGQNITAMFDSPSIWGGYANAFIYTGYNQYGSTQIITRYNAPNNDNAIAFRVYNQSIGGYNNWTEIWTKNNLTNTLTNGYLPYWNGSSLVNSVISQSGNIISVTGEVQSTLGAHFGTIGNSNTLSAILGGYGISNGSVRYGRYGQLLFNAGSDWTAGARKWLITNAHQATKFAIIRSVDSLTNPSLGIYGEVSSGIVDLSISNIGNIGIGYTDRSEKLAVAGSGYFNGNITANSLVIGGVGSNALAQTTAAFNTRIDAISGNKSIYLFNNGSTLKLDAYDYGTNTPLGIEIGGNGGNIYMPTHLGIGIAPDTSWTTIIKGTYPLSLVNSSGSSKVELYADSNQFKMMNGLAIIGYSDLGSTTKFTLNSATGEANFASSVTMLENINTNLRIPKVAPTSPTSGEYYFYIVE